MGWHGRGLQGSPLWLLMSSLGHVTAMFLQHLYLHLHIFMGFFQAMKFAEFISSGRGIESQIVLDSFGIIVLFEKRAQG